MTFRYLTLELTFVTDGLLKLPPFIGSMLRGAFGASLKQMHCLESRPCLKACQKGATCVYGRVFETPLMEANSILGKVTYAPHPFALFPVTRGPQVLEAGQELVCHWTIWGDALNDIAYMLLAWAQAGRKGFGFNRCRSHLTRAKRLDTQEIVYAEGKPNFGDLTPAEWKAQYDNGDYRVLLKTMSPLRLKFQRQLVGMRNLPPADDVEKALFANLERRLLLFSLPWDNTKTNGHHPAVSLRWQENTRFSNRQNTTMEMGGVEGFIHWPRLDWKSVCALNAGEVLQVGKNTSMGLGKYQLEVEAL